MSTLRASRVRTVNDKIRWTSHSSFVIVASVVCVRTVNDKIRWTSHSSFVIVASVACVRTVNGNFTVRNMLLESATCRLRRERETNEERCARFVVASPYCLSLITFVMPFSYRLARPRGNEKRTCTMEQLLLFLRAYILYIVLATSTFIFRYGQAKGVHAPTLQLDRHYYYYYSALKYTHRLHIMIQAETHTITIRLAPTMFLTSV